MVPPASLNQQSTNYVNSYDHEQENATNIGVPANSFQKKILILSTLKLKKHTESAGKTLFLHRLPHLQILCLNVFLSSWEHIYLNFPINTWKSGVGWNLRWWNPNCSLDTNNGGLFQTGFMASSCWRWHRVTLVLRPPLLRRLTWCLVSLNHPSYYLDHKTSPIHPRALPTIEKP